MPVEWLRPTNTYPSPGSTYDSVPGTNSDGTSIDVVTFAQSGVPTYYLRNLSLGAFPNPVALPPTGTPGTYNAFIPAACDLSFDGQNWSPDTGSGPFSVKINNDTAAGSTTSNYSTEMIELLINGSGPIGSYMLRESPTKQSLGRHTVRSDPRGYRISSFFDVFLELSFNDGPFVPANRSIRVQASAPPAAPNSIFVRQNGTDVILDWLGSFTLQSATDVTGPYADVVPGPVTTGPYGVAPTGQQMYFRLRQ